MNVSEQARDTIKRVLKKAMLPWLYRWYLRRPMDETLVVFADYRDRPTPDNFLPMQKICEAHGYRCVILSGHSFGQHLPKWPRRWERLKFTLRFVRLFAVCRALFLVEYFPLAYLFQPRAGTDVVQLWHGCGAMKRFGYSAVGKNWGMTEKELERNPMHTNYTLACVSGEKAVKPFEDAFRFCRPGVVQAIGVPRTDIYFDKEFKEEARQKVRALLSGIKERKIILYAPTFRGRSIADSYFDLNLDLDEMAQALGNEYVLLLKLHPLTGKINIPRPNQEEEKDPFVFDVSHLLSPEEALCAADVLVTDYSSVLFEYLLLERPVISYIYDIDQYCDERGMYYPYQETAPGPYAYTQGELISALQTVPEWFDVQRIRKFRQEFMGACDGQSTQRIFEHIFLK